MDEELKHAVEFHGHFCPGLAIGYRVAEYVGEHYPRAEDEELVENNSCSVDAVQAVLGCTFGKGNLVYRDFGKQVFTFYSRGDGKALRIYYNEILSVRKGGLPGAGKVQNLSSPKCRSAAKASMEIRGRTAKGKVVCKECYERILS